MNAVWKIIELVKAYPNQIEMVCLGPLTNLALAIRLEPTLPRLLKRVVVLSGTLKDLDTKVDRAVDWNIEKDPEAATIVFEALKVKQGSQKPKLLMVPWEVCISTELSWDFYKGLVYADPNEYNSLLKKITHRFGSRTVKLTYREKYPWQVITGDAMALSALLDYRMITKSRPLHVSIERNGPLSRGRSVIDWSDEANWVTAQVVLSIN